MLQDFFELLSLKERVNYLEKNIEFNLNFLKNRQEEIRRRLKIIDDYIDTISSPLWKRIIWWFQGFYFNKVGKWYAYNWIPKWPR